MSDFFENAVYWDRALIFIHTRTGYWEQKYTAIYGIVTSMRIVITWYLVRGNKQEKNKRKKSFSKMDVIRFWPSARLQTSLADLLVVDMCLSMDLLNQIAFYHQSCKTCCRIV